MRETQRLEIIKVNFKSSTEETNLKPNAEGKEISGDVERILFTFF